MVHFDDTFISRLLSKWLSDFLCLAWWGRMDFTVDDGAGNQLFNVKESKLLKVQIYSGTMLCIIGEVSLVNSRLSVTRYVS